MKVQIFKAYWCKCGNDDHPHRWTKIRKPELHGKGSCKGHIYAIDGKHCCEEMEKALEESFIHFGDPEYPSMTRARAFSVVKRSWVNELLTIKFCPFCGEKIEYEECGDYEGEK